MTTSLSANGGALSVHPTRRFGPEALSYELRGLTDPGSFPADATEKAHLVKEGWVDELPSLEHIHYETLPDTVSFGNHNVVEQTYVNVLDNSPVLEFSDAIRQHIPEDSYVKNPINYFTRALIRAKPNQPSTHTEFTAHPLVAQAMLKSHGDLGRAGNTALPISEALANYFPNVVKLFTEVTDPEKCRAILGDALALMYRDFPETKRGLFFPVFEIIRQGIK